MTAARKLGRLFSGARVYESCGDPASLIDAWHADDIVIAIDAVTTGGKPGTIHRFDAVAKPLPAEFFRTSTHILGLAEAVELARALSRLPHQLIFYGIEAKSVEPGAEISPEATAAILRLVDELRSNSS